MNKVGKVFVSIILVIIGVLGAICLAPFVLIYLMVDIPACIIKDIWDSETSTDDNAKLVEKRD